jgi:hypothetical protein
MTTTTTTTKTHSERNIQNQIDVIHLRIDLIDTVLEELIQYSDRMLAEYFRDKKDDLAKMRYHQQPHQRQS